MESKLNALLVIVTFVTLSVVGFLLKAVLKLEFDTKIYFWYLLLLCGFLMLFGRPLILLALDLVKNPYRENEAHFPLPGDQLKVGEDREAKK
jgi:hypothetical protein